MKFRLVFSILALLVVTQTATAARPDKDLKTVVAALEQGYAVLADLQADFSQKTTIASMKREERGAGEVFLKKPADGNAMFRFNYTKPRQQIVSNGKKVWYYLPDNKQVMVSDVATMFSGGNTIALNYLTGLGHVSRDFSISFAAEGRDRNGNYVLDLVPKKQNQMLEKLQLTISAEAVEKFVTGGKAEMPFPIIASVVQDTLGNRTAIEYGKVKVNRGISADRFNFKIPSGVEVIKQ